MPGRFGLLLFKDGAIDVQSLRAELRAVLETLGRVPSEPPSAPSVPTRGHIPTAVNEDGRIVTPKGAAPRDLSEAIRRHFHESVWTDAAHVSYYESSWDRRARNGSVDQVGGRCNVYLYTRSDGTRVYSEESVGYFQINRCAHGGSREEWEDADKNVAMAARLYRQAGNTWRDWLITATDLGLL
jgi:hypothetical protein